MAAKKSSGKQIKLTLIHSPIGYTERAKKKTVRALGLRRLNYSVVHQDTPALRGMLDKVIHLVKVEEA
jgi:large subunit ribosomal protein L30